MAQIEVDPMYHHRLAEYATLYLQTRDPKVFPFTANFDEAKEAAFVRDLREGLADLQDSGSARKTSAVGYIMKDSLLEQVIRSWGAAMGDWPATHIPANRNGLTSLPPDGR